METTNFDPTSLLQNASPSNVLNDAIQPLIGAFVAFTIISIVLTIAIVVIWIMSLIRRRKVQAAIFDIQAVLHEMNERDKLRQQPTSRPRLVDTAAIDRIKDV